jgi:hypothetical protein
LLPDQHHDLRNALLEAFPDRHDLYALLWERMGWKPGYDGPRWDADLDNLLTAAAARGWWEHVLVCACAHIPGNQRLQDCAAALLPVARELIVPLRRWWRAGLKPDQACKCCVEVGADRIDFLTVARLLGVVDHALDLLINQREAFPAFVRRMDELAEGRQPSPPALPGDGLHVMVLVKPLRSPPGLHVQSWLFQGRAKRSPLPERRCDTKEEVRDFLPTIWEAARTQVPIDKVRFEFVLPQDDLRLEVDQWAVPGDRVLGFVNPVVVRPLERAEGPGGRNLVSGRWQSAVDPAKELWIIQGSSACVVPGAVHVVAAQAADGALFKAAWGKGRLACTVLWYALDHGWHGEAPVAVRELIKAGVPIVLWLRTGPELTPRRLKQELTKLMKAVAPRDLPEVVWRLRMAADGAGPEHLGHHVVLLYEDPCRQPPLPNQSQPLEVAS